MRRCEEVVRYKAKMPEETVVQESAAKQSSYLQEDEEETVP